MAVDNNNEENLEVEDQEVVIDDSLSGGTPVEDTPAPVEDTPEPVEETPVEETPEPEEETPVEDNEGDVPESEEEEEGDVPESEEEEEEEDEPVAGNEAEEILLEAIGEVADEDLKARLENYFKKVTSPNVNTSELGAINADIGHLIVGKINGADGEAVIEDLCNLFVACKDTSLFNVNTLLAYDYEWNGNLGIRRTFQQVIVVIDALADGETRDVAKGSISIESILGLAPKGKENLIKYFEL